MSHEESSHHPPRNKSAVQCILNTSPVCLWSITLICLCQFYSYAFIIPILIPVPVCVAVCVRLFVRGRETERKRVRERCPLCLCIRGMVFKLRAFRGASVSHAFHAICNSTDGSPALHCSPSNHSAQQPGRTESLCAAPSISPLWSESTA